MISVSVWNETKLYATDDFWTDVTTRVDRSWQWINWLKELTSSDGSWVRACEILTRGKLITFSPKSVTLKSVKARLSDTTQLNSTSSSVELSCVAIDTLIDATQLSPTIGNATDPVEQRTANQREAGQPSWVELSWVASASQLELSWVVSL